MKILFLVFPLSAALLAIFWLNAGADEKTVNTTVTPTILSIQVTDVPAYGNVPVGTVDKVPTPNSFTVTNNGTEVVDLDISGANSTQGWTLSTATGADAYVHWYWTGVGADPWKKLSTTPVPLKQALSPTAQQSVLLKLDMPTSSSNTGQHILPVKVLATAAD